MKTNSGKAVVVGAGPNGLAAGIVLAQAGLQVEIFEAEQQPGGAARTMELTLPGFQHDFGSAVHPMAAASPFFSSLPLRDYGLAWIHSSAPLAHPFDDRLVDPRGSQTFFDLLPPGIGTIHLYPQLYHEIFNEFEADRVFGDVRAWVQGL